MANWDDHRFFLAVARGGSINTAARKLGVNRSTVARRVTALETALGVRLFDRQPQGYVTTPAGDDLTRIATEMEALSNEADRHLGGRDDRLSGLIRLSVPAVLASALLLPDLARFTAGHPEIELEVLTTYNMPDLDRREADIAIRLSDDPPGDLVGRRVLRVARAIYMASDLTRPPQSWIGWANAAETLRGIEDRACARLPLRTIITDPGVTAGAVRAGMGISVLPCFMGDGDPGLRRVPPGRVQWHTDLWVLTHRDLRNTARIRVLADFVTAAILRQRDLIEGTLSR